MTARRYATLDGLRGVAAISVLLLHLERPSFHMPRGAYTAVDLFFLMSGFVIAQSYAARIDQFGVLAFLRARVIRLYPMLLVGLLILPAYSVGVFARHGTWLAGPWDILGSLAAGLLLLPSHLPQSRLWDADLLFPLNGAAWSLMLEMAVNLAYAVVLPWLSRGVLLFIVLVSGALLVAAQVRIGGFDLGWGWATLCGGFPRAAFSFFLGVLIHRLDPPRPDIRSILVLAAAPLLFLAPPLLAVLLGYPLVLLAATRREARGSRVMTMMGALSYPRRLANVRDDFPIMSSTGVPRICVHSHEAASRDQCLSLSWKDPTLRRRRSDRHRGRDLPGNGGADVIVNYVVNPRAAEEVAHAVEVVGRQAFTVKPDVSRDDEVAPTTLQGYSLSWQARSSPDTSVTWPGFRRANGSLRARSRAPSPKSAPALQADSKS